MKNDDRDEYEEYVETHSDGEKRGPSLGKIIGKTFKYFIICIILGIVGVSLVRIIMLDNFPAEVENYYFTEKSAELYRSGAIMCYEIEVAQNYSDSSGDSHAGDFFLFFGRLTETGGNLAEIQCTVRYNDSTLLHRGESFNGSGYAAGSETDPFVYVLMDDLGHAYEPVQITSAEKSNLNYRRLVFEDVDMTDVGSLYINVYHTSSYDFGSVDTSYGAKDPGAFSCVGLFSSEKTYKEHKFSKKEIESLNG